MKVLVVGSGAREHALVWKLFSSPDVDSVYCAPGNGGTAALAPSAPVQADDIGALAEWAEQEHIDLTVVGPEAPLAAGIADIFAGKELRLFGPQQSAALVESSKLWAKGFMERHGIPTARSVGCQTQAEAVAALAEFTYPVLIKADGLAGGKGVTVVQDSPQAQATIEQYMVQGVLGEAGRRVLVEEFLVGQEVSAFALHDGKDTLLTPLVRDYKRLGDRDSGPNTGGMGSYAPVQQVSEERVDHIRRSIFEPALAGLEKEQRPFRGVLYAGLMLTAAGLRVLEFNCRFGDPETQVLLPLLESDLLELLLGVTEGSLGSVRPRWSARASCGVVLASAGYPADPMFGCPIRGFEDVDEGVLVFHAGTRLRSTSSGGPLSVLRHGLGLGGGTGVESSGGRVLTVVGTGEDVGEARWRVYSNLEHLEFDGMQFRTDIGEEAVGRRDAPETGQAVLAAERSQPASAAPSGAPAQAGSASAPTIQPMAAPPELDLGLGPMVSIVIGSESDRETMSSAARALEELGISHELETMSAHRTPLKVQEFAHSAEGRGVRVIIAGAGLAAHLPGVIAAWTTLPVIGVPLAAGELRGVDSLLSIVQMPPGVPVATVGIGAAGARNAAYLAAGILALADPGIRDRYVAFRREQSESSR